MGNGAKFALVASQVVAHGADQPLEVGGARDDAGAHRPLRALWLHKNKVEDELPAAVVDHGEVGIDAARRFLIDVDADGNITGLF